MHCTGLLKFRQIPTIRILGITYRDVLSFIHVQLIVDSRMTLFLSRFTLDLVFWTLRLNFVLCKYIFLLNHQVWEFIITSLQLIYVSNTMIEEEDLIARNG